MSLLVRRIAALGLAGTAVAALTAGGQAVAAAPPSAFPPLNPAALQAAIRPGPDDGIAGAIARVGEPGQLWRGSSTDLVTGRGIPADAHAHIGSISKAFEATVVLQLAAEGRVDLGRPVQSYLPGLLPDTFQPITVRQLINYTSGLPDVDEGAPDVPMDQLIADRDEFRTFDRIIQDTLRPADRPWPGPHFAPGTKQEYNSLGFRIAGKLIEQLTGHSFEEEVTERIVEPLHLDHTSAPGSEVEMPRPYLHAYLPDSHGTMVDVSEQGGNPSNMISTPADLDRFITALFQGRLLPEAQLNEMFTLPKDDQGKVVPYVGADNCAVNGEPGPACMGVALKSVPLPNGTVLWGKTGHDLGYANGVFATRDLSVRGVYSVATTSLNTGPDAVSSRLLAAVMTGK